ncbi:MAG: alpha/beta hydrolase [Xanthobacteraceae bacterium]|nr:MAG: alpha/beta hydrolase [Xanthobacteraceae bacterium]
MVQLDPTGFLDLGDQQLEYRHLGPRPDEAPAIVLLHEGLGCAGLWLDFPDRLAAATGAGVFVYSRAGYGASSPVTLPRPLTYMHDEALVVLPRVLDAIGFRAGMLLGHSDGGSIAAIHAGGVRDPRVKGISLIAPHFFTEEMGLASIALAREKYENDDLRPRLARWHRDVDNTFWGWNGAWLDPDFRAWNLTEYLPTIGCPVQVMQGDADIYGTFAQVETLERMAPGPVEVVRIPGVGHSPHREAPEVARDAASSFFKRIFSTVEAT